MNCAQILTKNVMMCINAFFMLLGILIIGIGSWALARTSDFGSIIEDGFYSIPALVVCLGVFVTILFFLGCYGLKRESYPLLCTFTVILTIILAMEIIGGISAYVLRNKTDEAFNTTLITSLSHYEKDPETKEIWDKIQSTQQCCGVNNATDYAAANITTIPQSCCSINSTVTVNGTATCNTTDVKNIYFNGCSPQIHQIVSDYITVVAKVALIGGVLHLLWILGSSYFAKVFKRQSYESV